MKSEDQKIIGNENINENNNISGIEKAKIIIAGNNRKNNENDNMYQ